MSVCSLISHRLLYVVADPVKRSKGVRAQRAPRRELRKSTKHNMFSQEPHTVLRMCSEKTTRDRLQQNVSGREFVRKFVLEFVPEFYSVTVLFVRSIFAVRSIFVRFSVHQGVQQKNVQSIAAATLP
jgi:hypothetical protein